MCAKCGEAVKLLMDQGFPEKEACDFLMCWTPFPFGDGDLIKSQVVEYIKKRAGEWLPYRILEEGY
jgi:hypothetical protein